jgi:hypothetical protein
MTRRRPHPKDKGKRIRDKFRRVRSERLGETRSRTQGGSETRSDEKKLGIHRD